MTTPDDGLPDWGNLAFVNFDPRVGHEQSGHRPAVILTPREFHAKNNFMIVCPITSNMTPFIFKVAIPDGLPIRGSVLVDQVKSVDRRARGCEVVGVLPIDVMAEIRGKLASLLGIFPT